mgnify:CR=1 FL=1
MSFSILIVPSLARSVLQNLSDLKKTAKSDKDSDQIKKINAASRSVSKQSALAIKLYHANIDGCVHALKAAINPAKAAKAVDRAAKVEETKDKIKSKMPKFGKKSDKEATSESAIFNDDRFFKV